jgi:hypothetical protein
MSVAEDVKSDLRAAKKLRLPWWVVLFGTVASFLCASLFDKFGKLELALPALNGVAVLGFMIVLKRKLWTQLWFWATMAVVAAVQVAFVALVPWTSKWVPALAIAAIDSAELCVMIWVISIIGRLLR